MQVRSLILPWGNPYYTKLSLAAVGGSPPDVAISHATRLTEFAPADLLEPLDPRSCSTSTASARTSSTPRRPGSSARYDGRQYAIPLDTHPFVLYVNTKLAKQAGLLDASGTLKELNGAGRPARRLRGGQAEDQAARADPWRPAASRRGGCSSRSTRSSAGKPGREQRAARSSRSTTPRRSRRSSGWPSRTPAAPAARTSTTRRRSRCSATARPASCSTASGRSRPIRPRRWRSTCSPSRRSSTRRRRRPTRTRSSSRATRTARRSSSRRRSSSSPG